MEKEKTKQIIQKPDKDIIDIVNEVTTQITNESYKITKKSNYIKNWRESNLRDLIQEDRLCITLEEQNAPETFD